MPHRFIKNTCFSTANSPDISSEIFSSVARNTAGKCHNTSFKMYGSQLQICPNIYQQISTFLPQTLLKQCPVSSKIPSFHRKIIRRSCQKYLFLSPQLSKHVIKSNPYSCCPIKTPGWKMSQCDVKNIQSFHEQFCKHWKAAVMPAPSVPARIIWRDMTHRNVDLISKTQWSSGHSTISQTCQIPSNAEVELTNKNEYFAITFELQTIFHYCK